MAKPDAAIGSSEWVLVLALVQVAGSLCVVYVTLKGAKAKRSRRRKRSLYAIQVAEEEGQYNASVTGSHENDRSFFSDESGDEMSDSPETSGSKIWNATQLQLAPGVKEVAGSPTPKKLLPTNVPQQQRSGRVRRGREESVVAGAAADGTHRARQPIRTSRAVSSRAAVSGGGGGEEGKSMMRMRCRILK